MRREIKDPLNELLIPATAGIVEVGTDVHDFVGSNPDLIKRGKAYLHKQSRWHMLRGSMGLKLNM